MGTFGWEICPKSFGWCDFLEFVLNRCGHFSKAFLGGIDGKHEWG